MANRNLKGFIFGLLSFGLLVNIAPVNSQEVIDDYWLQQLQQLDGGGSQRNTERKESSVSSSEIGEMRRGIRQESGKLIASFQKHGCYEEADLMREARDIMIREMSSEVFRWGGQQIELLSSTCQLRMLGSLGK